MKKTNESHPTELALLEGKRLAISPELDRSQHWAESRIKELAGTDTITARKMRQDFYEFDVTSKHIVCGNYEPAFQGGDAAMQRRIIQIRFNQVFSEDKRDPDLLEKLKEEADGIMGWLVKGAKKWYRDGLQPPPSVKKDSDDYFRSMDDIGLWLEECCDVSGIPRDFTSNTDLYESYKNWKLSCGTQPLSRQNLSRELKKREGIQIGQKRAGHRGSSGIILKGPVSPFNGWKWTPWTLVIFYRVIRIYWPPITEQVS